MLRFERTYDYALVRHAMTHPRIYPWISDDGSASAEDFQPPKNEAIWYVRVIQELCGTAQDLGIFILFPQNAVCWEIHTCLLPEAWGPRALEALQGVIAWAWANTTCRRIVTSVPEFNGPALRFGRKAGLIEFGRNPKSYLKHGKLHDQILMGLSPEE